ncbi:MAG: hypothetical protein JO282_15245 [Alphaproteobacteria bacterium]|nr:hypothetical protein [Alphaproteobacteria bacterium]MBV8368373.1 hypothetical protein [Candidatus Eremiobacteraeota bacterium]
MNAYTPGDLISFGIFIAELAVLCLIGGLTLLARLKRVRVVNDPDNAENRENEAWADRPILPEALYDRAFEVNRDINSEIQGVESGLLAILAAVAAVVVLTIDKLTDLGVFSLSCIGTAFLVCGIGYLRGRDAWRRKIWEPSRFFYDLILDPDETYRSAAIDLIKALRVAQGLLNEKRRWAMIAILTLIIGTLAAGCQKVIHFERNDSSRPGCETRSSPTCRPRGLHEGASPTCCLPAQGVQLDSSSRGGRS